MRLFQENKVNPMAGCLPLIVQMPIFIALYNSIYYNPHLREHTFLWLELGKPDHLFILPVLAALTTFIQTRMMTKMNPVQQQVPMQFMMMIYPVLIFVMSYNFLQPCHYTGCTVTFTLLFRTTSYTATMINTNWQSQVL